MKTPLLDKIAAMGVPDGTGPHGRGEGPGGGRADGSGLGSIIPGSILGAISSRTPDGTGPHGRGAGHGGGKADGSGLASLLGSGVITDAGE